MKVTFQDPVEDRAAFDLGPRFAAVKWYSFRSTLGVIQAHDLYILVDRGNVLPPCCFSVRKGFLNPSLSSTYSFVCCPLQRQRRSLNVPLTADGQATDGLGNWLVALIFPFVWEQWISHPLEFDA
eukprot:2719200-Amphidinium_carterae.1